MDEKNLFSSESAIVDWFGLAVLLAGMVAVGWPFVSPAGRALRLEVEIRSEIAQGRYHRAVPYLLERERVAVIILALPTAEGGIVPGACAPPAAEARLVHPGRRAAAGARLDERPVGLVAEADAALVEGDASTTATLEVVLPAELLIRGR